VWRETGIVEKLPTNGLKYRWRVPIGGGYSGPAVANGRVYVMDRQLATGAKNPASAFTRGEIPGSERVLCLNEADGKILWQHEYDCPYTVSYAGWSARYSGSCRRKDLHARCRRKPVLPRRGKRHCDLVERFQKEFPNQDADVGLRRPSAGGWKETDLPRWR
jgi:hypothetical protein